ncbi:MAG: hypothetical protein Q8M17_09480 [Actinomycetota bacterium]|nr:hypothetical protein [Actinomycetota bacterium]
MSRRSAVTARLLAPLAVAALVLAGCSSGGDAAPSAAPSETAAAAAPSTTAAQEPVAVESYPLPDCTGQDASTCVYDGFDPTVDGFGFENWGAEGTIDASILVALFGEDAVCAEVTASGCVVYPAAAAWADQVNEAMAAGHCEGMAVLSRLIYDGYMSADSFEPGVASTAELLRDDPDVAAAIDLWWATQMLPPVQAAYSEFKSYQPSEIAYELAQGLQSGKGYTLGIYSADGGHAITPIGVALEGDLVAVSVYDNNYPGTVQRVTIDLANETWSYAAGATNPDAPTGGWEGGQGTIELTPMASRELPSIAPFDDSSGRTRASAVVFTATSADPLVPTGIVLTIDGQEYDTSDPSVELPEGVVARSILGATLSGKGKIVSVNPRLVGAFGARAKVVGDTRTPVTLSYDRLGSPRVTLRADVDQSADAGFDVDPSGGAVRTVLPDGAEGRLQVDNGLNRLDFALPDGVASYVGSRGDGQVDIAFLDQNDELLDSLVLDADTDSGRVVYGTGDFDPDTGAFEVTEEFAEPEELDESLSASLTAGLDEAFADLEGIDEAADEATDEAATDDGSGSEQDDGADGSGSSGAGTDDDSGADDSGVDDSGADDEPVADEPVDEEPAADEPVDEEPVADEPADESAE